jgi:hypothetical protein
MESIGEIARQTASRQGISAREIGRRTGLQYQTVLDFFDGQVREFLEPAEVNS